MWPNTALTSYLRGPDYPGSLRNYEKENRVKIRQIQFRQKQRRIEEEERRREESRRKPLKATLAFDQVKSKVAPMMKHYCPNGDIDRPKKTYLQGHVKSGPFKRDGSVMVTSGRTSRSSLQRTQSLDLKKAEMNHEKKETGTQWDSDDSDLYLNDDVRPSTRYSDITVDERRSRVRQLIEQICATPPLCEGRGLVRSSSLASLELRKKREASKSRPLIQAKSEKSVQTEGLPEVSLAIRSASLVNLNDNRPPKKVLIPRKLQSQSSEAQVDAVEILVEEPKSDGDGLSSRLDKETKHELKLDLRGIEGSMESTAEQMDGPVNFVRANKQSASVLGFKKRQEVQISNHRRGQGSIVMHKLGSVPKYLTNRKEQWKKDMEQKERDKPDLDCPQGHVRLEDSVRLFKLDALKDEYERQVQESNRLSVRNDTFKARERRRRMEEELSRLEEAIRVYSRPKVYVPLQPNK